MYACSFKAHKDGLMVIFDSIGMDRADAIQRGQEFGNREFGSVEMILGGEQYNEPRITNVEKYRWNGQQHELVERGGYAVEPGQPGRWNR